MNIPYVVGQWVRGDRFYGRLALLRDVLEGGRDRIWVAGMRRVGKTSLLRQLELLAGEAPGGPFVPVVWDLQGSDEPGELDLGLHDALLDVEARLSEAGVELPAPGPAAETIAGLASALGERGRRLLLLCDEAEDLFALLRRSKELAASLESALTARESRVVLASSVRLFGRAGPVELAEKMGTGLLEAFGAPVWLGPLDADEARALLRQDRLPAERRPVLAEAALDLLTDRCGGHPFLLQIAAKRTVELGDAGEACEKLTSDQTVTRLCATDLGLLEEADREMVADIAAAIRRDGAYDSDRLARLRGLGLVREGVDGRPEPGNWFLSAYLAQSPRN